MRLNLSQIVHPVGASQIQKGWLKNNLKVKSGETVKAIDLVKVGVHLCFNITEKGQMIEPD